MRRLFIALFILFMGCTQKNPRTPFGEFDVGQHCASFSQCYEEQYGKVSSTEMELCRSSTRDRYLSGSVEQKALLDAFYFDCKLLSGCAYGMCFISHLSAHSIDQPNPDEQQRHVPTQDDQTGDNDGRDASTK